MPIGLHSTASTRRPARTRAAAVSLGALILLSAGTAHAVSTAIFFGEDIPANPGVELPTPSDAESAFVSMLVDEETEDFSGFDSGDEADLDILFGTLSDPTSDGDGFIATAQIAATGFPISGSTYWKNTTEVDEGLFTVTFEPGYEARAFGFYATAYSTQAETGGTRLVLRFERPNAGGSYEVPIGHSPTDSDGKAFYFGVIVDPADAFESVTLLNLGSDGGDVIGFDDFTVARSIVPEPSTGLLLASGLLGLAASRRSGRLHRDR
jgi:hypothetical protein